MFSTRQNWLQFSILATLLVITRSEVFTSMANMENLVATEKFLLKPLNDYIKAEEEKLAFMKTFMEQVDFVHEYMNESGINKYLGNPINVYLMLRRMSVHWKHMEKMLKEDTPEAEGKCYIIFILYFYIPNKCFVDFQLYSSFLQFTIIDLIISY